MTSASFTLFDTAVGHCAIIWRAAGIAGFLLPDGSIAATTQRVESRFPGSAPAERPPAITRAITAITALLEGHRVDLTFISLDFTGVPPFHARVYQAARGIPAGTTCTYGELAARIGAPGAARAVGQALGRNPFAVIVPCHRVLARSGAMHGFSAPGGLTTKRRLLDIEGATIAPTMPTLF